MISTSNYFLTLRGCIASSALILLSLLVASCNSKSASTEVAAVEDVFADTLPADFVKFFNRFHEDTAFQMAHINFPLEGLPAVMDDEDTLTTTRYFWQRADWKKHNHFTDPGGDFEHWYEIPNDRLIEHWIQMKGTNLYMRRRFAKLDDEWYLIYYQGLRPVKKE